MISLGLLHHKKKIMSYLRKTWVRIIISLLSGGLVMELIHISTGDPNREMKSNFSLLIAGIIYAMLSYYIRVSDWKRSKGRD